MGARDRDQQAELERQRLEQELAEQQLRTSLPREQQTVGEDELSKNPVIINK